MGRSAAGPTVCGPTVAGPTRRRIPSRWPLPREGILSDLVIRRPEGLYCPFGDFHIDPWRPVERAVITHAHADHARPGCARYLASARAEHVLRARLGAIDLQCLAWGESITVGSAKVSLHPAGHVLGAAQVRIEHRGRVWVVSGDYTTETDETFDTFEAIRCDTFITESTFGLPIYRWPDPACTFASINEWWQHNAQADRASVLFCYSFGKAQRILAHADASIGLIVAHGATLPLNEAYRATGIDLPAAVHAGEVGDKARLRKSLVLAPPSAAGSPWLRRFGEHSDAFASGWMQLRGARRRRALDRGFVLSDHADWPGLQSAIAATGAQRVIVTHGYEAVMVRWLLERGLQAESFETEFGEGDGEEARHEEHAGGDSDVAATDPRASAPAATGSQATGR